MKQQTLRATEIRVWQLPDLCETVHGPVSEPVAKFLHEGLMVGLLESGCVDAAYRGASHRMEAGALIVVPPEQTIAFDPLNSATEAIRTCVHCPPDVLQNVADEIAGSRARLRLVSECVSLDPAVAALIRNFQRALQVPGSTLESTSRLYELLTEVARRHLSTAPPDRKPLRDAVRVRRVREYLDEHFADNISLDDLARMVSLSAFHLNRAFRREVGLPPHAYQTQVRVRRAKMLIANGSPIGVAAIDVGFCDQSHFTYHFKRLLSFTPGAYRQNVAVD